MRTEIDKHQSWEGLWDRKVNLGGLLGGLRGILGALGAILGALGASWGASGGSQVPKPSKT